MTKLAFLTDLQLDDTPPCDRRDARGMSTRFGENNETIKRAFDAAIAAGADAWLFGGDATEKKNPSSLVQLALASLFRYWLDRGKAVCAIPGNHDGSDFDLSSSSIEPLALLGGDRFQLHQRIIYDPVLRAIFIPYIHRATPEDIRAMLMEVMAPHMATLGTAPIFAVQHYGARGSTVGADNTVLAHDYLGADLYEGLPVDHVMCGHIHKAQETEEGGIQFHTAGSPVMCNFGERNDRKTWGLFDTVTRVYEVHDIAQPRRWVSVDWENISLTGEIPWNGDDIVRITGEHQKNESPRLTLEAAFKDGTVPRPFYLKMDVKQHREQRVMRSDSVSTEGGLKAGLLGYVRDEFHRESDKPGHVEAATRLVLDVLAEQQAASFCAEVTPHTLKGKNFTTFLDIDYTFRPGEVVLISAPNGTGKSKFHAATYFCMTGELPDGGDLVDAVRRDQTECKLELVLHGNDASKFRITRSVSVSASGAASQDLSFERFDIVTGDWDKKSLNNGGIRERQAKIDSLIGGSAFVQRLTAFSVQDDQSPFIRIKPTQRKAVISEATGQEPLRLAHKVLDERRKATQRDLKSARDHLGGLESGMEGADTRLTLLQGSLSTAKAEETAAEAQGPGLAEAASKAQQDAENAKGVVESVLRSIASVPNTGAVLEGAKARRDSYATQFETRKAEKRGDYDKAKTEADTLTAEMVDLVVPDPAVVAELESNATAAGTLLAEARTTQGAAATASATAVSASTSADRELERLDGDLKRLPTTLPTFDIPALEAAVTAQGSVVEEALAKRNEASAADAAARVKKATISGDLARLRAQLAEFDGKDVGTCSRCGQAINSAHIEVETERLKGEIKTTEGQLSAAEADADKAASDLDAAARSHTTETGKLRDAERALEHGRTGEKERLRVEEQRAHLSGLLDVAKEAARVAGGKKGEAQGSLQKADDALQLAIAAERDATALWRNAADAAATVAAKQERLSAARKRMDELVAAGKTDKETYDAEIVKLDETVKAAEEEHQKATSRKDGLLRELAESRGREKAAIEAATLAAGKRDSFDETVSALRTRIADITQQIDVIEEKKKLVEDAKFKVGAAEEQAIITSTATELIEQYRVALIDQALPFIEERANYWLDKLGAGNVTVSLSTLDGDKESLMILVDDGRPGRPLDIRAYSGGQKRRVEMAIKLAFSELKRQALGVELMLKSYDEPTDGLDSIGRKAFVDMILAEAATGKVIILTSHDSEIIASFDNVIRLSQGVSGETIMEV